MPLDYDDLSVLVKDAYWDEEASFDEAFEESPLEDIWEERKTLTGMIAAIKRVRDALDAEIAERIGQAKTVRLDDYHVRMSTTRRLKVIDPIGFKNWVGKDWDAVINPLSATLRVKALRALAEARQEDPDMATDAFCKWVDGPMRLTTVPIDKAPKYAQEMEHGEVR